jgi:ABC-type branched-subunit amino acid transport system substrate-binding protein
MLAWGSRGYLVAGLALVAIGCAALGCGGGSSGTRKGAKYQSRTGHCRVFDRDDTYVSSDTYIGALMPYGDVWNDGPNWEVAAGLALDEINASPGAFKNGNQLGLIICNSACNPQQAQQVFAELIGDGDGTPRGQHIEIAAILGPGCSEEADAIMKDIKQRKVLVVSPSAEAASLTLADDGDFFFRTTPADNIYARPEALWLRRKLSPPATSLAIVREALGNWEGLTIPLAMHFMADGGQARDVPFDTDPVNALAVLKQIDVPGGADTIYLATLVNSGASIFREALTYTWVNISPPRWEFSTGVSVDDFPLAVANNAALEGLGGMETRSRPSALRDAFITSFTTAKGAPPDSIYVDKVYDAIYVLAASLYMAANPSDGSSVRDALRRLSTGAVAPVGNWQAIRAGIDAMGSVDLDGTSGTLDFDMAGDVSSDVQRFTFKNGKVVREPTDNCYDQELMPCK